MSRASTLFRLQEIDLELDAHHARLEAITEALSGSAAVRAAQQAALEAEAQFNAARVEVRTLEYDNQALSEKMAEVEKRLYSGVVTNAKELQDLHKDMQLLQHRRAALEEQQFEALIKAETAEARLLAAQHAFQQAEAEAARTNSHLVEEQVTLQTRGAKLEEEREATQASIPAEDRELYERLRQSKNGRPVARLEDGVCAACGVAPSSARSQSVRQGGALTRCGNCERILYAE